MRAGGKDSNLGLAAYDDTADNALDLLADLVPQWIRVLRETGWLVVFMNRENYDYLREAVSTCCATHYDYRENHHQDSSCRYVEPHPVPWIWYRPNSRNRPRYPERHAQNVYEQILVCNMGKGQLTGPCQNLLTYNAEYGAERVHDHQKPIELAKELVRRFTMIGDTVLDTTFGSGMLLAGAAAVARNILGSELNPSMLDIAYSFIRKYQVPAPSNAKKQSEERYKKHLETGMDESELTDQDYDQPEEAA